MDIANFISKYTNYPILFIGTGLSVRYLEVSYTWDALLSKIAYELKGDKEYYLKVKASCQNKKTKEFCYGDIAQKLEEEFNLTVDKERHGKFEKINDIFFEKMDDEINISRFKIYITELLKDIKIKDSMVEEIESLKQAKKNIGSVITTNYDKLIQSILGFKPLIGNDILLSNPYGSVYKIHGCVDKPEQIIVTKEDYEIFNKKYDLIRAQLISLFIHNPIIFLGYSITDDNIKKILDTIFSFVPPNSVEAQKIRHNFLLVEYDEGNQEVEIIEHDIDVGHSSLIRINKIKTDNYIEIYKALSMIHLPVSVMEVRKVQELVQKVYSGGDIKVAITDSTSSLDNGTMVAVISYKNDIKGLRTTSSKIMEDYFKILEEEDIGSISLIDSLSINKNHYFPMFAFAKLHPELKSIKKIIGNQENNLSELYKTLNGLPHFSSVEEIEKDKNIAKSSKDNIILYNLMNDHLKLEEVESFLKLCDYKKTTAYRKLLCAYDMKKYK